MRSRRIVYSIGLSCGVGLVLLAGVCLLTEKIVIYPHARSLPLLNLNRVESTGFQTLSHMPGLHPREAVSPPDWMCGVAVASGVLLSLWSLHGTWTCSGAARA